MWLVWRWSSTWLTWAARGGRNPLEQGRSVAKRSGGPALGGSTESLSAPLPPHAPLPTETGGSGGPPGPLAANPRRAWWGAPSGAERRPYAL